MCEIIAEEIIDLDEDNEELYEANLNNYIAKLVSLNNEFESKISGSTMPVIFADRFPFLYLFEDYNISYFAAFQGCSAETEASFETIAFLTDKAKDLNAAHILIQENGMENLATTIIANSNIDADILHLSSLDGVSRAEYDGGSDYISLMRKNLEVLSNILN